tara:strand:+ start:2334 stop:3380 length:1047 start_codon:yes stop_codon:yes gene_type:complete
MNIRATNGNYKIPPKVQTEKIKASNQKLLYQMQSNPLGDIGGYDDAIQFRNNMDAAFRENIPQGNKLRNSITQTATKIQNKCINQMKNNQAPQLDKNGFLHLNNKPTPNHLHLSFFGTRNHSVDLVITKKESNYFVTICNRGQRTNHKMFETYKITENINTLLEKVYKNEQKDGGIDSFYQSFGIQLTDSELEIEGFKTGPPAKEQKTNNCVRASMSAAQKWMAHQHDCPLAHKAVKPNILENISKTIKETIRKVCPNAFDETKTELDNIESTLKEDNFNTIEIDEKSILLRALTSLLGDFIFFRSDNENTKQINTLLDTLSQLDNNDFHKEILNTIREQLKQTNAND